MATAMEVLSVFNELTERMGEISTTSSSQLLFKSLKLSFPLLQSLPAAADGRAPLTRAYSVAYLLADLQMDAEVVSSGILREVLLGGAITMDEVEAQISPGTAQLLQESMRMKDMSPSNGGTLDDETARALRKQILTCYHIKAVILEIAVRLDSMRHLGCFPKYHQQKVSLEALKVYAPIAHAVGAASLSLELEDLSFRQLFPSSYDCLDTWLSDHEADTRPLIGIFKDQLLHALKSDGELLETVNDISVKGRIKSRFSTMKKLLEDERKPEEVHDILGMRVILDPKPGEMREKWGIQACYRTLELIQGFWTEVPKRRKDYIQNPKGEYKSLHAVIDIRDRGASVIPLMEVQIRTTAMDMAAETSHSLYKGCLEDPEEAQRLKETMLAAAEVTALHLKDLPSVNHRGNLDIDSKNPLFCFIDENGDGRISIEELTKVMEDFGAEGKDALELMQLLDANNDGFLSSEEFDLLQKQVGFMRNMEDTDDHYRNILGAKFHVTDGIGLLQIYQRELSDKLLAA